ncbi:RNA methyltransferase [Janibacter massiliensis]|uniref:RNA methyltransferase n=1 Tax=Janibacter massiliensis TaxID=2058291 RepID=UPI000D0FA2A0
MQITSPANPRLKGVAALRRRREREDSGTCLVEGYEELALAMDAGAIPEVVLHCAELMLDPAAQLLLVERARSLGAQTWEVARAAFEKTAYREGPDGFLAVVPTPGLPLAQVTLPPDPLVLLCEGIEKPGNLGAMLRTADAAGIDLVVAVDPVTDWGNPNVVRGSKATVFSVPVASATLGETIAWLADHGVRHLATTPDTETVHTDVDWSGPVAFSVGTEKYGLTDAALEAADERIRIPMHGVVNSLNVATSAAIVAYEALRHRSRGLSGQDSHPG